MHGWRQAGAAPTLVHIERWIERPSLLRDYAILTFPGGFSYGDDIAAGKVFAAGLGGSVLDEVRTMIERGGGVLGICNGLQVLVKAGLLPGGSIPDNTVTVTYNASGKFEARWVRMKVCRADCPYLAGDAFTEMPVEHGEGRVVADSDATLAQLESAGHVALRYVASDGESVAYPANPNGSFNDIAGLCDPTGRVLGLMPHPDRHLDPTNHPLWTRRPPPAVADGLRFFRNAVQYWK